MKLRLRKLAPDVDVNADPATIEGEQFRDWLIIRVGNDVSPRVLAAFRDAVRERLGEKVMVVQGDVEFLVFEEVNE